MHWRAAAQVLTIPLMVGLALLGAACSSSSSSAKSSPAFSKGLVYFYSPTNGAAPKLSAAFTDCTWKALAPADRDKVAGAKSVSQSLSITDAVSIRVIRASEPCDHTTTATGVQNRLLDPGEGHFHLTATQKSCVREKVTKSLPKLDETKIQGTGSADVSEAIIGSFSGCVPVSQFIAGSVEGELSSATPAQAQCVGDAVAKTTTYDQMIKDPDTANSTVTSALATCGVKTS